MFPLLWGIAFNRPGSDLLSRVLRRSTIGAGVFHGRVRNGNGWGHPAITTRSTKGNVDVPADCRRSLRSWIFWFIDFVCSHGLTAAFRLLPCERRGASAPTNVRSVWLPCSRVSKEANNKSDGLFEHVGWSLRCCSGALGTHTGQRPSRLVARAVRRQQTFRFAYAVRTISNASSSKAR